MPVENRPTNNCQMIRIKPKITSDEATEAKLLKQLKDGSYEAFATVYRRYSPRVYRTVSYLLGNEDMAEDIVQDLFLTIWNAAKTLTPTKISKDM